MRNDIIEKNNNSARLNRVDRHAGFGRCACSRNKKIKALAAGKNAELFGSAGKGI